MFLFRKVSHAWGTPVMDRVQLQSGGRKEMADNERDVIAGFPEQSADCRGSVAQVLQIDMPDADT